MVDKLSLYGPPARTRMAIDDKWFDAFRGKLVRIYSGEHCAWWRHNGNGYTKDEEHAGKFSFEDAYRLTAHTGPEQRIQYDLIIEFTHCYVAIQCGDVWKVQPDNYTREQAEIIASVLNLLEKRRHSRK